jgi:hypothetical protein
MSQKITLQKRMQRRDRVLASNLFLQTVAQYGKQQELTNPLDGRASQFILDERARVWYWDSSFKVRVFTSEDGTWKNFSGNREQAKLIRMLNQYCSCQEELSLEKLERVLQDLDLPEGTLPDLLLKAKQAFEI